MAIDSFLLVDISVIVWILLLTKIYQLLNSFQSIRIRIALPTIIICLSAIIGSLFTYIINGDIVAVMLTIPIPTSVVFTYIPILEREIKSRIHWFPILIFSIFATLFFFYYLWGSNFGGIRMIFLSFSLDFPSTNPFNIITVILVNYLELLVLAGIFMIIIIIAGYIFRKVTSNN
jgi:hypothetical protein